jgi:uncharacterized metal-binding protein YceD (DUF177 family)
MQYNVAQLLKEPTGAFRQYELSEDIATLDPELEILAPLVGTLHFIRTNSGILVMGDLSTTIQAPCNLCMEPIDVPVQFRMEETFRPLTEVETGRYLRPEEYKGDADDLDDAALFINEQHILNIAEIVRQNIWLSLPMYPTCIWGEPSECPNLTKVLPDDDENVRLLLEDEPTTAPAEIDPRWAALLNLQGKLDSEKN